MSFRRFLEQQIVFTVTLNVLTIAFFLKDVKK